MYSKNIERLIFKNEKGDEIEFSVKSPYHTNISKDVEGLSDIQNESYHTTGINQAGGTYLGYHVEARDITIIGHIKERNKERIREYRHALSHAMSPAYKATLTYAHGEFKRIINCRANSDLHFRADGVFLRFEIELLCLNPYWTDGAETIDELATWIGGFEFDADDGLELTDTDDNPLWEIGYRQPRLITSVQNSGDTTTGMEIKFIAQGTITNPGLIDINTREFIQVNITMHPGEEVIIKTGYGQKSVKYKKQSGDIVDAFRHLDINSTYLQLNIGSNPYRYYASNGEDNLDVVIKHSNQYLGV